MIRSFQEMDPVCVDAVTGVLLSTLCDMNQMISRMQLTKRFFLQVKMWSFVQQHLLKTSKSIRELHSSAADVVHKVRE